MRIEKSCRRILIEQQLHRLRREVLQHALVQIKRELFVETFRVDVLVHSQTGTLPLVRKLAPSKR